MATVADSRSYFGAT